MEINKNDFISDYVIEAQENLDGIDNAAISLINTPRDYETLKELLRLLHTLKGSSRMMDFLQIEQVVNNLETVFKNFQANRMEISSSFCYLLLNVDEVLRRTISRIQKNKEDSSYTGEDFGSNIENFEFIIENIKAAAEGMAFTSDFSQKNVPNENDSQNNSGDTTDASVNSSSEEVAATTNSVYQNSTFGDSSSENQNNMSTKIDSVAKKSDNSTPLINDTKTIKIQISQINSILQNYDKLLMRQIKLKKELSELKKEIKVENGTFQIFREITENIEVLENQSVEIQKQIISLRMLPFDMILQPIKRSIFQEALKMGKNIDFDIPNSEITIDKTILESLPPIIMHLARNALDHGIESSAEREKLGKPQKGKVSITVEQISSRIFVSIKDDGRGIDYEKIRQKAMQNFPERVKEIKNADEDTLLQFIFMSGFSTKEQQTALSGRGIGLDVVRTEMEKLKGKIRVESKKIRVVFLNCLCQILLQRRMDFLFRKEKNRI